MLVLVVEIMGASTVVLYGINLLFLPDAPVYHPDPARPGLPKVRHFLLVFGFLLYPLRCSFLHLRAQIIQYVACWPPPRIPVPKHCAR